MQNLSRRMRFLFSLNGRDEDIIYQRRFGSKKDPSDPGMRLAPMMSTRWIGPKSLIAYGMLHDGWVVSPYRIDLARKRVRFLDAFAKHTHDWRDEWGAEWRVSPDNKWVLWPMGGPAPNSLCATRIDGSQHHSFWEASHWDRFFGWLPGNQPVFLASATSSHSSDAPDVPEKVTALIYDLKRPQAIQTIAIPPLQENHWAGVSPKGEIFLVGLLRSDRVSIAQITLSSGKATLRRTTMTLPIKTEKYDLFATLSPEGGRLLWSFGEDDLGISRSDGTGFHRLGSHEGVPQWHPSGKAISLESETSLDLLRLQ